MSHPMIDCNSCGYEYADPKEEMHECECGWEMTAKQCKEWNGTCDRCARLYS